MWVRITHLEVQIPVDAVILAENIRVVERRALRDLHMPLLGIIDTIFAGFGRPWCENRSKHTLSNFPLTCPQHNFRHLDS